MRIHEPMRSMTGARRATSRTPLRMRECVRREHGRDILVACLVRGSPWRRVREKWHMEKLASMSKEGSGVVLWLTGLSGAGKSTIVRALAPQLEELGKRVEILDGDVVRAHLSGDLGFSRKDRDTNIARIAFVAHLLARNGVIVLVAAISPFRDARDKARRQIGDFVEVHVAPPLDECIKRDVKGLYKKALAGEIQQFTGVNDPYEAPLTPELEIDTSKVSVAAGV